MTPRQVEVIQSTWRQIAQAPDMAADLFYERLFQMDPGLRPLFENVDLGAQKTRLLQALSDTVSGLDDPDALIGPLAELGRRHAVYGVRESHYETVGAALLWTLEQGLGADWADETRDAWTSAYQLVAQEMMKGVAGAPDTVWRRAG